MQPTYTILFIVFHREQDNEESLLTSPPHTLAFRSDLPIAEVPAPFIV